MALRDRNSDGCQTEDSLPEHPVAAFYDWTIHQAVFDIVYACNVYEGRFYVTHYALGDYNYAVAFLRGYGIAIPEVMDIRDVSVLER